MCFAHRFEVMLIFKFEIFNPLIPSVPYDVGKHCRPRSDTAKCGVQSGSALFFYKTLGISPIKLK